MKHEIARKVKRQLTDIFGENRVKAEVKEGETTRIRVHVQELTGQQFRQAGVVTVIPDVQFIAKRSGTGITLIFS